MSRAEEVLLQLEERLSWVVQRLRVLDTENIGVKREIEVLRKELEEASKENLTKDQKIKRLNQDRLKIRTGIEHVVQKIDALDEPIG